MASKEENIIELLVTGFGPDTKKALIECYFDAQELEVVSVSLSEQGKAVVKLTGLKDVDSFCAKTHKIKNKVITIEQIHAMPELQEEEEGEGDCDTIEVVCDSEMETSMLELYFEGPKSGGGRSKTIETIRTIKPGKYRVKFESIEDVNDVLAKESHAIMKKPISVHRLLPPTKPQPKQDHELPQPHRCELDKLVIDNIPDTVDEELLTTFLDGRLDLEHEEDYTVRLKHPRALVNFTKQYSTEELNEFSKTLINRKFKGQILTVELCPVNRTILITKIGSKNFSSQDGLEIYFDNKKSGCGADKIESIIMLGSNRARITFNDSTVVASVLSKQHTKLGPDVMLVPSTPLQDESSDLHSLDEEDSTAKEKKLEVESSTDSKKTPEIVRKPVTLPLDPVIAKYLQKKSELLDGLSKEVFMTINIANGAAVLQPNDSSPPDYSETSLAQFQHLLSAAVSKVDIDIPSEAAKEMYPIVMQKCNSENLEFVFNGDQLSIAGEARAVTDLQNTVQELSKRSIQTTEEFKLEHEEYEFFTNCKLKEVEKKHHGVKLLRNDQQYTLSISGSIHDVSQFKESLSTFVAHATVPVNVSRLTIEFLHTGKGPGILATLINDDSVVPFFSTVHSHSPALSLLCSHDNAQHAEKVALTINDVIVEKEFEFSSYFFSDVADSPKFSDFKQKMIKTYAYVCTLEGNRFKVACRKEILQKLIQSFEKFVAEECSITDKVTFKKGVWRLINSSVMEKRWHDVKEAMAKNNVAVLLSSKDTAQKPFVRIKGEREAVAEMKAKIIQLRDSVKEEQITVSRPGVLHYFFKDPNGEFVLKGVESQAKVCIELEVKKDESDSDISNTSFHTGSSFKRVCFANMKGGTTINVSVGDITQFNRAEVIVNAANEDLDHGSGVAGAISDRGGPIITKDSINYTRKHGRVSTGSAVIFHHVGNLPPPYKAIVHAVGPRWNSFSNNEREIALLRKAMKTSLKVSRDYSSIAIPAISSGVYGFPSDVSANTLVKAVIEYFDGDQNANLNDIHFVILKDNVDVFIKAIKANFENVHTFSDTPPVSSTPIKPTTSDAPMMSLQTGRRGSSRSNVSLTTSIDSSPVSKLPTPKVSLLKYMKITNGDILKHQCEVLVNTTNQQLSFGGFVGRILLKAAGQGLEDESKSIIAKQPIQHGDVVVTGAHQLDSKHIVHVVLPGYSGLQSETTLRTVVRKCLQECARLKAKSISIPSVGAGNLGYPGDAVAKCLLEETLNYLTINEGKTSLQLVHFVIFDPNIHRTFQSQYAQISNPATAISSNNTKSNNDTKVSRSKPATIVEETNHKSTAKSNSRSRASKLSHNSPISSDADSCSFSLSNGGVLQLVQGDITIEQTDVIVNTTNPELRLVGSGVSGALLKKGGTGLQAACDTLRAQNIKAAEGKVVETRCEGMGQLQCKSIFHIVFDGKEQVKLVKTILACLDRAEKMKYTSIALPAIGTGNVAYPTMMAAEGIVKALKKFIQRKPNHVKKIRMVIFMPHMFKQFTEAFKKIEESESGILSSIYDKGTKFIQSVGSFFNPDSDIESDDESMEWSGLEDDHRTENEEYVCIDDDDDSNINTLLASSSLDSEITMCIYGESDQSVKRAEKRLTAIIDTQFVNEEVNDSNINALPQSAIDDLTAFANERNVDIDIDNDPAIHTIKLHGCQSDVMKVKDQVRDVLSKVHQWKTKEEAAATVYKHVQWVRQLSNDQEPYSEYVSYEIEQAFQQKKPSYRFDGDGEHFKIDFSKSEEADLDSGGTCKVTRVDFSEVEKPPNWSPMPKDANGRELTVHLVTLNKTDPEYKDSLAKFDVTMKSRYSQIVSIQCIQNPVLYGQYIARKKEMEKRNPPGCLNERYLFHGTNPNVVDNINTQGFNRSFKHVTAYGQGAYFARDATYSSGYAPADANQHHYMYLTRVLTGEFAVGNSSMLVPPPKNNQPNKHVLFDSTVNSTTNPSIFVVYTDPQAYAAYLITYK